MLLFFVTFALRWIFCVLSEQFFILWFGCFVVLFGNFSMCICVFLTLPFILFEKISLIVWNGVTCIQHICHNIEPVTTILGGLDLYIDVGSTINLWASQINKWCSHTKMLFSFYFSFSFFLVHSTCIVRHLPEPPSAILWSHKNQVCKKLPWIHEDIRKAHAFSFYHKHNYNAYKISEWETVTMTSHAKIHTFHVLKLPKRHNLFQALMNGRMNMNQRCCDFLWLYIYSGFRALNFRLFLFLPSGFFFILFHFILCFSLSLSYIRPSMRAFCT